MTTDLSNKSVEELIEYGFSNYNREYDSPPWVAAMRVLAGRLEEAQQQIVAQQALIDEVSKKARSWIAGNLDADIAMFQFARRVEEKLYDDLSALAAHDAEVAAEALDETIDSIMMGISIRLYKDPTDIIYDLRKLAAEYRAKATEFGRKE